MSAIADHLKAPPLCIPVDKPVMDDSDLLEYRSPVRPPPVDSEFGRMRP